MRNKLIYLIIIFVFSNEIQAQFEWVLEPIMETSSFLYSPEINDKFIRVIVENRKKESVLNKKGEIILSADKYQSIQMIPGNGMVKAMRPDRTFILMNKNGKIIGSEFDKFNFFEETNLIKVMKAKVWGLMDTSGVTVVKPKYIELEKLKRGLFKGTLPDKTTEEFELKETSGMNAFQEAKDLKIRSSRIKNRIMINEKSDRWKYDFWGFTNMEGDTLLRPNRYYSKEHMIKYEEQVMIGIDRENDKQGVIDKDGKIIIPFEFEKINHILFNNHFIVKKDGKTGLLDMKGNTILPFEYSHIHPNVKDNYLLASSSDGRQLIDDNFKKIFEGFKVNTGGLFDKTIRIQAGIYFGFFSVKTKKITEPKFKRISHYFNSVCGVATRREYGLLDIHSGEMLTEEKYLRLEQKGKYFFGDYHLRDSILVDSAYQYAISTKTDLLDFKGNIIDSFNIETKLRFLDDDYFIQTKYPSDTVLVFDYALNQKKIIKSKSVTTYYRGKEVESCEVIQVDEKFYFIDDFINRSDNYFEYISPIKDGLRYYKKDGLYGFMREHEIITPPLYDEIREIYKNYIRVGYKGKWGILKNDYYEEL